MSVIEVPVVAPSVVAAPVTKRDVLHRAADLLEEFGWCQRSMAVTDTGLEVGEEHKDAVAFCAQGAICRADRDLGGDGYSLVSFSAVERVVGVFPLYVWNNAPERTKAEVVAALRNAAERTA